MNVYVVALAAYFLFSISDALVKSIGRMHLSIFETSMIMTLTAGLVLLATRHPGETWRTFHRHDKPWIVHGRAIAGVSSLMCSVYAFTSIPLAQAYALIFLSPIFVTAVSALFLKEPVGLWRWIMVCLGFAGVIMVLQPGYQPFTLGHLAAIGCGLSMGMAILIMRAGGATVKRTSVLGTLLIYLVATNTIAAVIAGIKLPTLHELAVLLTAGTVYGLGQWAFMLAPRYGNANQVAPMHYSQLIWANVFGITFFHEIPNSLAMTGVAIILLSGTLTFGRDMLMTRLARATNSTL